MEKYTVTEEYAKDMVGRLLGGFDKETVAQLVDQGMKKTDPLEVHSYFVELLGESEPVFRFVEEFNRKRFSSKKLEKSKAEKMAKSEPPKKKASWATRTAGEKVEEEKQKKEKTPRNRLAGVGKGGATTSELLDLKPKTKAKNKIKVDSIAEIDQALRDLELVEHGDVRKDGTTARAKCDCMASRHPLLEVAPNCMNCGKIHCLKEGLGPCTFCGTPLLSAEERNEISSVLYQQKEDIRSVNAPKQAVPKKKQKAIKYNLSNAGGRAAQEEAIKQMEEENRQAQEAKEKELQQAKERLDTLMAFQDSQAERTRIIDNVGDFELPSAGVNQWASATERALQLKKQQRQMAKMEERDARKKGKKHVISLGLDGKIREQEMEDDSTDDEELRELESKIKSEKQEVAELNSQNVWNPAMADSKLKRVKYVSRGDVQERHVEERGIIDIDGEDDEERLMRL
ncbi:putative zinc finger motif, C2HC5-type-domain-containing protein [Yarrowia lipolytica]|nr:putative zinc finger motif, C2HC5-type-domain-containing protein [Yarrowia lipolytica]RDW47075.1 putative zinc finger motif, C2HC5-type-domain-containing protein [Yarrowia lipolytica]RDW52652.1 putative zinc finger motif, C2HC5-type-domain-containing protein [Yarrowia lipolytica]